MQNYFNGQFYPADQPCLRADDAGFQHAVGLFETLQCHHGRAYRLEDHLARLAGSAADLGLFMSLDTEPLAQAVAQTVAHNGLDRARLRLTITPGTLSLLRPQPDEARARIVPSVVIVPSESIKYDPAYFTQGVTVTVHGPLANPFDPTSGHKTLNYWPRLRALRQAASLGAAETIILNVTNHLAGGAVSNLLLVKGDALLTPIARGEEADGALPSPVLPGVTRGVMLGLAEQMGLRIERRMLTVTDLLEADEAMLTNSGWGVLPIARVERKDIGAGGVGQITQKLRSQLLEDIERATMG
jgi:branched-subunit amino acid aminotransferase/4-amino-4-deoxychorismate lyase